MLSLYWGRRLTWGTFITIQANKIIRKEYSLLPGQEKSVLLDFSLLGPLRVPTETKTNKKCVIILHLTKYCRYIFYIFDMWQLTIYILVSYTKRKHRNGYFLCILTNKAHSCVLPFWAASCKGVKPHLSTAFTHVLNLISRAAISTCYNTQQISI